MIKAAITTGSALLARIGLSPKSLSAAGTALTEGLKRHGTTIGTAATVASLLPTGSRNVVRSAAGGSEARNYVSRYRSTAG